MKFTAQVLAHSSCSRHPSRRSTAGWTGCCCCAGSDLTYRRATMSRGAPEVARGCVTWWPGPGTQIHSAAEAQGQMMPGPKGPDILSHPLPRELKGPYSPHPSSSQGHPSRKMLWLPSVVLAFVTAHADPGFVAYGAQGHLPIPRSKQKRWQRTDRSSPQHEASVRLLPKAGCAGPHLCWPRGPSRSCYVMEWF